MVEAGEAFKRSQGRLACRPSPPCRSTAVLPYMFVAARLVPKPYTCLPICTNTLVQKGLVHEQGAWHAGPALIGCGGTAKSTTDSGRAAGLAHCDRAACLAPDASVNWQCVAVARRRPSCWQWQWDPPLLVACADASGVLHAWGPARRGWVSTPLAFADAPWVVPGRSASASGRMRMLSSCAAAHPNSTLFKPWSKQPLYGSLDADQACRVMPSASHFWHLVC